jgi:ubiquinone/menaquinone biosynthesis C-methylase UbiE
VSRVENRDVSKSLSAARRIAVGTQRRRWQRSTDRWEDHGVSGLTSVIDAVLAEARPWDGQVAVDIGSGGGALALRVAPDAARVLAVDVSPKMLERLSRQADEDGLGNVETLAGSIEALDLPPGSVDLVVSNYALHHLLDRDKASFVRDAHRWLRPGGKLVIGDMMLGRGWATDDRQIMLAKVRTLMARGPSGWWRVAKNGWRLMTRTVERPIPIASWVDLLNDAGFVEVTSRRVVAEAGVVCGQRALPDLLPSPEPRGASSVP